MTAQPQLRVHVVCTANVCRSVMAEAALRHGLGARALVSSSGLLAESGPPDPHALSALERLGVPLPEPRTAQRLSRGDLETADLILGMATHHVRDVVVLDRGVFPRAFSLGEVADLARRRGGRRPGEPVQSWIGRLHEGRTTADLLVEQSPHDVVDPTGGPPEAYRRTAVRVVALANEVASAVLAGGSPTGGEAEPVPAATHVEVVFDADSAAAAAVLARSLGGPVRRHAVTAWEETATRAQQLVATGTTMVVCVTTDPHGAAMVANRDQATRAVVVGNAGLVRRSVRRLDANVLCLPNGLDRATLSAIAGAAADAHRDSPE